MPVRTYRRTMRGRNWVKGEGEDAKGRSGKYRICLSKKSNQNQSDKSHRGFGGSGPPRCCASQAACKGSETTRMRISKTLLRISNLNSHSRTTRDSKLPLCSFSPPSPPSFSWPRSVRNPSSLDLPASLRRHTTHLSSARTSTNRVDSLSLAPRHFNEVSPADLMSFVTYSLSEFRNTCEPYNDHTRAR